MTDKPEDRGLKGAFPENVTPINKYENRRKHGEDGHGSNPLAAGDVTHLNFKVEEMTDPAAFMEVVQMMHQRISKLRVELEHKDQQIDLLEQQNAHLEGRLDDLEKSARLDPLTGLINAAGFEAGLEEALARIERGQGHFSAALIYIDLDKFKPINDTYGHEAGDQALKVVARHLENFTREYEHAARLHGDEFALIVTDETGEEDDFAVQACRRLAEHMDNLAFEWQGTMIPIGASVGVTSLSPALTVAENLNRADQSMYVAKRGYDTGYRSGHIQTDTMAGEKPERQYHPNHPGNPDKNNP